MASPEERDRFLSALYESARQDGESPEEVAARIHQNARGVDRRELLQIAGGVGAGGLLGAGGYKATQPAAADASTSDDDGDVGEPGDRVDAYLDGADANVVTAGEINNIVFPELFGAEGDGQTDDTQPIQDAIDSVGSGETAALWFQPGKTYYITSSITVPLDRIRAINGNNAYIEIDSDIVVFDLQGNSTGKSFPDNDFNTVKHDEVVTPVTGLQIYSTTSPSSGTGIQYSDVFSLRIVGNHLFDLGTAIRASGMDRNTWICGNHIYHNSAHGIHSDSTHNIHQMLVANNFVFYNDVGIYSDGGEIMDWVLHSNQFEVGTQDVGPTHIVHIENTACRGNRMINNEFQDHSDLSDSGVKIDITSGDHERWSIRDNDFTSLGSSGSPVHALEVIGGGRYKVEDNTFNRIYDMPIVFAGMREGGAISARATIQDNEFWHTDGICEVSGSGDILRPVRVTGNSLLSSITPTNPLIAVDTAGSETIRSLRVEDNDILVGDVQTDDYDGALVDVGGGVAQIHVTDNQVYTDNFGGVVAIQVNPDSVGQAIIKDNISRFPNTSASEFDFPDDTPDDVIVKDNITYN